VTETILTSRDADGGEILQASSIVRKLPSWSLRFKPPYDAERLRKNLSRARELDQFISRNRYGTAGDVPAVATWTADTTIALVLTPGQAAALPEYVTYSTDIAGDGSQIGTLVFSRSPSNPTSQLTLYINGVLTTTAVVSFASRPTGSWVENQVSGNAFDASGQVAGSGALTMHYDALLTTVPSSAGRATGLFAAVLRQGTDKCQAVFDLFSPTPLLAQGGCGYYQRQTIIALAGMTLSALTSNVGGFFLGAFSVANSVHGYARCMERK